MENFSHLLVQVSDFARGNASELLSEFQSVCFVVPVGELNGVSELGEGVLVEGSDSLGEQSSFFFEVEEVRAHG